jgi:hypothetical protein
VIAFPINHNAINHISTQNDANELAVIADANAMQQLQKL